MPLFRRKWSADAAKADQDDFLIVIRADGQVVTDTACIQERGGILRSRSLKLSLPTTQPVPFRRWSHPEIGPTQTGLCFVFDSDPPMPDDDEQMMLELIPTLSQAYETNSTVVQRKEQAEKKKWKGVVAGAVVAAFLVAYVVIPLWRPPQHITIEHVASEQEEQDRPLTPIPPTPPIPPRP